MKKIYVNPTCTKYAVTPHTMVMVSGIDQNYDDVNKGGGSGRNGGGFSKSTGIDWEDDEDKEK